MCVLKFWERVASLRIIYVIEQRKRSLNDVTICWAAYGSTPAEVEKVSHPWNLIARNVFVPELFQKICTDISKYDT